MQYLRDKCNLRHACRAKGQKKSGSTRRRRHVPPRDEYEDKSYKTTFTLLEPTFTMYAPSESLTLSCAAPDASE